MVWDNFDAFVFSIHILIICILIDMFTIFYSQLEVGGPAPQKPPVLQLLTLLGQSFSKLVDFTLGYLIKVKL